VPDTSGAIIEDVTPGGPAAQAGLKNGDVVRKYNGQSVGDSGQLIALVTETNPGTTVKLDILRNGEPMTIPVTLGERPADLNVHAGLGTTPSQGTLQGITVQALTPEIRQQFDLPPDQQGVVISNLDPSCPAAQAGLQPGDVIEEINRHRVSSVGDFQRLAAEAKGDTLLRLNRQGNGAFIVVSPNGDGEDNQQ